MALWEGEEEAEIPAVRRGDGPAAGRVAQPAAWRDGKVYRSYKVSLVDVPGRRCQ